MLHLDFIFMLALITILSKIRFISKIIKQTNPKEKI